MRINGKIEENLEKLKTTNEDKREIEAFIEPYAF